MTDKAEQLTERLRKEFGNVPQWKTTLTRKCLEKGEPEWNITVRYHEMARDYNLFRPLARMVHRMCKKEIGKHPGITEDTINRWLSVDGWTDDQVKAEYQQQFDYAQSQKRRAKRLLVEMRRDIGDCHTVGVLRILKWIENGLTEGDVRGKYKDDIKKARRISRAEALQFRLEDELSHKPDVSALLALFYQNLDDDGIVDYYRKKIANPEAEDALEADSLSAGGED